MIGIWVGNALIAAAFVTYWLIKYPSLQADSLMFKHSGLGEMLVSICTWGFYLLALSLPFSIYFMARAV